MILALFLVQAAAAPPACVSPEHRQFDFWVGRWAVHKQGDEKIVAHSVIEKLYDGCAIREKLDAVERAGGRQPQRLGR